MNSILVALVTLAVALPLATAQYYSNCYVNVCGYGGNTPLIDTVVPPGYEIRELAPEGYCMGYPITGITTTVCASDVTPLVRCADWGSSVIVTRMGMPTSFTTISMSVSCGYPYNFIPPLAFKSTQESAIPKAEKIS